MLKKRLFERIGNESGIGRYRKSDNHNDIVFSIVDHLKRILNTRQGSALIAGAYGLPDFNDLARQFPDAILILRKEIWRCIEMYEPRLRNVRVEYIKDPDAPLSLKFEIAGELAIDDSTQKINIETRIDASGYVDIRG